MYANQNGLNHRRRCRKNQRADKKPVAIMIMDTGYACSSKTINRFLKEVGVTRCVNANFQNQKFQNAVIDALNDDELIIVKLSGHNTYDTSWHNQVIDTLKATGVNNIYVVFTKISLRQMLREFKPICLVRYITLKIHLKNLEEIENVYVAKIG